MKKTKEDANAPKEYVHMLNGTLCATQRTLTCILENYFDEEKGGVRVPKVLRPFIEGSPEFYAFPVDETLAKKTAKMDISK